MHFPAFKTIIPMLALALFGPRVIAQRLQLQATIGANFSRAYVKDTGQPMRDLSTFYDTLGSAQFGLALNARLSKHFYLRLDGSFRAYRTFYDFRENTGSASGTRSTIGNLFNEKFSLALLPEYRRSLQHTEHVQISAYGFAGPVLSFEKGKNFSESYVFDGLPSTVLNEIKPDVESGWCAGLGINPQMKRFGLLLELRYTRLGYAEEGLTIGKIAYGHFNTTFGLTVNLL